MASFNIVATGSLAYIGLVGLLLPEVRSKL